MCSPEHVIVVILALVCVRVCGCCCVRVCMALVARRWWWWWRWGVHPRQTKTARTGLQCRPNFTSCCGCAGAELLSTNIMMDHVCISRAPHCCTCGMSGGPEVSPKERLWCVGGSSCIYIIYIHISYEDMRGTDYIYIHTHTSIYLSICIHVYIYIHTCI